MNTTTSRRPSAIKRHSKAEIPKLTINGDTGASDHSANAGNKNAKNQQTNISMTENQSTGVEKLEANPSLDKLPGGRDKKEETLQ